MAEVTVLPLSSVLTDNEVDSIVVGFAKDEEVLWVPEVVEVMVLVETPDEAVTSSLAVVEAAAEEPVAVDEASASVEDELEDESESESVAVEEELEELLLLLSPSSSSSSSVLLVHTE